ncbi:hypothetical protein I4F81_010356 [Pyropia yezoensis]|uniref:Uncharacterized protein n=1 Tax=Pyropia yezoensis TaxID=2788 RepID=A0ACC3CDG4_PYRYE|nr:hypothetical protein I4F81_010356 [Neopyropia yezoensis]
MMEYRVRRIPTYTSSPVHWPPSAAPPGRTVAKLAVASRWRHARGPRSSSATAAPSLLLQCRGVGRVQCRIAVACRAAHPPPSPSPPQPFPPPPPPHLLLPPPPFLFLLLGRGHGPRAAPGAARHGGCGGGRRRGSGGGHPVVCRRGLGRLPDRGGGGRRPHVAGVAPLCDRNPAPARHGLPLARHARRLAAGGAGGRRRRRRCGPSRVLPLCRLAGGGGVPQLTGVDGGVADRLYHPPGRRAARAGARQPAEGHGGAFVDGPPPQPASGAALVGGHPHPLAAAGRAAPEFRSGAGRSCGGGGGRGTRVVVHLCPPSCAVKN